MSPFLIGLDLGKRRDYTAIAVLERQAISGGAFDLRHLERIELNTSFTEVVDRVQELVNTAPLYLASTLIVDATGLGHPVLDLLLSRGLSPVAVCITSGTVVSQSGNSFSVPKRELIRALVRLLESCRLRLAADLPYRDELLGELQNFRVQINKKTGHDSYSARGSLRHDDIVLALALACWYGDR